MTGCWTVRKTKPRFPSLPTALGNRCCDSHIPTAATSQWKSGKAKIRLSHFPTVLLVPFSTKTKTRKEAWRQSLRSLLQAHSSMRKCSRVTCLPGTPEGRSESGFSPPVWNATVPDPSQFWRSRIEPNPTRPSMLIRPRRPRNIVTDSVVASATSGTGSLAAVRRMVE